MKSKQTIQVLTAEIEALKNGKRLWVCHPDDDESHIVVYNGSGCPDHVIAGGCTLPTQALLTIFKDYVEQIEKKIDGLRVDREATRKHMESKGATESQILDMEISADDTDDILDDVIKVLRAKELL